MKTVRRLRKMASLCRQQAAYDSRQRGKLLAEAEYCRLARAEVSFHFGECNPRHSNAQLPNEHAA